MYKMLFIFIFPLQSPVHAPAIKKKFKSHPFFLAFEAKSTYLGFFKIHCRYVTNRMMVKTAIYIVHIQSRMIRERSNMCVGDRKNMVHQSYILYTLLVPQ